jgi:hypothetical protein
VLCYTREGLLQTSWLALASLFAVQLPPLEGTQPRELMNLPDPSSACGCHYDYLQDRDYEPGQSYGATAMALSARDPLFRAALAVAYNDRPELTSNCLRCHAPRGWLGGRAEPGDGSRLEIADLDGISCDLCHRLVPSSTGRTLIGGGQYTIAQSTSKLGPRTAQPMSGHPAQVSSFLPTSEACAVCHSLFNPLEEHHDKDGGGYGFNFYEQRTYEEWRDSAFPARGKDCIDCHMKRLEGYSCSEQSNLYPDMRHHGFVGGNTWVARAVNAIYPQLNLQSQGALIRRWLNESLASAAKLEIVSPTLRRVEAEQGGAVELRVRFTNLTGHKLPTGYPEGRRIYLEVALALEGRDPEIVSGFWDPETGNVVPDDQLRTYDAGHGVLGMGRTFHLALANQTLWDTRLPPEGYAPIHQDMIPVGRDYGQGPPYRSFDEHTYRVPIPLDVPVSTTGTITVRALRQATTGQYVQFLVDSLPAGSEPRENLRRAYSLLGKVPPDPMTSTSMSIVITPKVEPPDAGPPALDATAPSQDAGPDPFVPPTVGGCGCETSSGRGSLVPLVFFAIIWARRSRSAGRAG